MSFADMSQPMMGVNCLVEVYHKQAWVEFYKQQAWVVADPMRYPPHDCLVDGCVCSCHGAARAGERDRANRGALLMR